MFRKKAENNDKKQDTQPDTPPLKHPKPHILLMDVEKETADYLRNQGFDIAEGSFGKPYKAPRKSQPVFVNGYISEHHTEKEIIIIELAPDTVLEEPKGDPVVLNDGNVLRAEAHTGIIDPRPIIMRRLQSDFNKIYQHGGIFIVFAYEKNTVTGSREELWRPGIVSTWSFLPELEAPAFRADAEHGKEITVEASNGALTQFLQRYIPEAEYICTLDTGDPWLTKRWIPLARNKYDQTVAGVIIPAEEKAGLIFIFPKLNNQSIFLGEFLADYLPAIVPQLFPHIEGGKWVTRHEYELKSILSLQNQITQIRQDSEARIKDLEDTIQSARTSHQYLYDLITESGNALVKAVKSALAALGFSNVVDMDEELQKSGESEPKREDLQIQDKSPLILVEIKGISNTPKDSSAIQVSKYLAPRMKSLNRVDIRGLAIVNHQRHIPALDRLQNPFNDDVLESALHGDYGLMTTWDLHRLLRNYQNLGWSHSQIRDIFYQNGFIEAIPKHYKYVGYIEHHWPKANAIGVRIETGELRLGDTVAYDFPVEFEEQIVKSLQIDREPVEIAVDGQLAGILIAVGDQTIKKGIKIYRVERD